MEKYSLRSNKKSIVQSIGGYTWIGFGVIIVLFVYMLLPVFTQPLQQLWMNSGTTQAAIISTLTPNEKKFIDNPHECIITSIPPRSDYDTMSILCSAQVALSAEARVFVRHNGVSYWVGRVISVSGTQALVKALSNTGLPVREVALAGSVESFGIVSMGGGAFVLEVPSSVPVSVGSRVTDRSTGYPVGIVSGVVRENATLMQRVYIRMPISFERMEHVFLTP
jgi:hypothetical protein